MAAVDPSRRCPFTRFEFSEVGSDIPAFVVRKLSVDDDAGEPWPAFPLIKEFIGKVTLTDLGGSKNAFHPNVPVLMQKCFVARQAIANKEIRHLYESNFGAEVDWKHAESSDLKLAHTP